MTAPIPEIVESCSDPHVFPSGNNGVLKEAKSKFADSTHWDELAEKHIPAFNLPRWQVLCTPEQMIVWLERLDFTEEQYQDHTNMTPKKFIELNSAWPLRAFIGLVLEMREEAP